MNIGAQMMSLVTPWSGVPRDVEIIRLPNGKWQHRFDCGEWSDKTACETDLRFAREWGAK